MHALFKNSCSLMRSAMKGRYIMNGLLDVEANRIVWLDMEMTGLDVQKDKIMEVACLVTDSELNIVAEGPNIIVNQPTEILDNMDEWCIKQHGKTGLTEACKQSKINLEVAENMMLEFIKKFTTEKCSPIAGNSVYIDRLFLRNYMPKVDSYLHYRIIDVSTVKELCKRWNFEVFKNAPKKEFSHRALNDIKESVSELKYYKDKFFSTSQCDANKSKIMQ